MIQLTQNRCKKLIMQLAGDILASQKGSCSMDLVNAVRLSVFL